MVQEHRYKGIQLDSYHLGISERPADIFASSFKDAFVKYVQKDVSERRAHELWDIAAFPRAFDDAMLLDLGVEHSPVMLVKLS